MNDVFADNWNDLTPDERFKVRMDVWQNPDVEFASADVKKQYQDRVQLFRDAVQLKKPQRVPIAPWIGLFPALWDGMTAREAYYDFARLDVAWQKWHAEFKQDVLAFSINIAPCEIFDVLDYKLYDWPGHGVPDTAGYQYVEKEWMHADEYDLLIADPSNFWQRFYLPRIFGAMEPWTMLSPFTDLVEASPDGPVLHSVRHAPSAGDVQEAPRGGQVGARVDPGRRCDGRQGARHLRHAGLRRRRYQGAV